MFPPPECAKSPRSYLNKLRNSDSLKKKVEPKRLHFLKVEPLFSLIIMFGKKTVPLTEVVPFAKVEPFSKVEP